jgi:hypothetical protein
MSEFGGFPTTSAMCQIRTVDLATQATATPAENVATGETRDSTSALPFKRGWRAAPAGIAEGPSGSWFVIILKFAQNFNAKSDTEYLALPAETEVYDDSGIVVHVNKTTGATTEIYREVTGFDTFQEALLYGGENVVVAQPARFLRFDMTGVHLGDVDAKPALEAAGLAVGGIAFVSFITGADEEGGDIWICTERLYKISGSLSGSASVILRSTNTFTDPASTGPQRMPEGIPRDIAVTSTHVFIAVTQFFGGETQVWRLNRTTSALDFIAGLGNVDDQSNVCCDVQGSMLYVQAGFRVYRIPLAQPPASGWTVGQIVFSQASETFALEYWPGSYDASTWVPDFAYTPLISICPANGGGVHVTDGKRLVHLSPSGTATLIAGPPSGTAGLFPSTIPAYTDGTGTGATFNNLRALTLDPATGDVYGADFLPRPIAAPFSRPAPTVVRKITPAGVVTTYAGTSFVYRQPSETGTGRGTDPTNGPKASATFLDITGLAWRSGVLYVQDGTWTALRAINTSGNVVHVAGDPNGWLIGGVDGNGSAATLSAFNVGLVVNQASGDLWFGADTAVRRVVDPLGTATVSTVAGLYGSTATNFDAPGATARFNDVHGVTLDALGQVWFVADDSNAVARIALPASSPRSMLVVGDTTYAAAGTVPGPANPQTVFPEDVTFSSLGVTFTTRSPVGGGGSPLFAGPSRPIIITPTT